MNLTGIQVCIQGDNAGDRPRPDQRDQDGHLHDTAQVRLWNIPSHA